MAFGSAFFAAGAICVGWFVTLPEEVAETSLPLSIVGRLLTLPILPICLAGLLLFGWGTVFVFFPRVVKRLTGREVFSSYH